MLVSIVLIVAALFMPVAFFLSRPYGKPVRMFQEVVEDLDICDASAQRKASEKLYNLLKDNQYSYYDDVNEVLGTSYFSENTFSRQPYVANGYIGTRIPNVGFGYALDSINIWVNDSGIPGSLHNGWPLRNHRFAGGFVSDFYSLQKTLNSTNFPELDEQGYSTVISTIPQWTDMTVHFNDTDDVLDPRRVRMNQIQEYAQNLSLNDGTVTTKFIYDDRLLVKTKIIAHRRIYPLGIVVMQLIPLQIDGMHIQVCDHLNFSTSHRSVLKAHNYDLDHDGIFMVVEPENVPSSNTSLFSFLDTSVKEEFETTIDSNCVTQCLSKYIPFNTTVLFRKYVGIISSEYNTDTHLSNLDRAISIVEQNKNDYNTLIKLHEHAWNQIYQDASIEIPSDHLLEMTAKSSIYHLLANTRSHNVSESRGLPLGVSGLSSDSYGGMVFWDSDIWILPALLPFFPDTAKQLNNYRNATHYQAQLNAQQYSYDGALYPWTSGKYANCTSAGPCVDYEYHINVDIALSSFAIYLNGNDGEEESENYLRYTTWPLVRDAALMFAQYVEWNKTLNQYTTHNMTDPDEYANFVDNGAFTNAGIQSIMIWANDIAIHLGIEPDPKWIHIADNIHIPISDTNITLEYSGMNSSVEIKQADVILMIYPLGYITDQSILNNAIKNLYYYSERQSASGPAMTYPVFVAGAASLLNVGCSSQSYLYKSVVPYLRSPFAQFSEQSDDNFLTNGFTQPAFPFLTANGGYLQSLLFGLTGLRYSYDIDDETGRIKRLLKFNPIRLPLLSGGIRLRNFKYMGQVLDIIISDKDASIVHKIGDTEIMVKVPDRTLIPDVDIDQLGLPIGQLLHGRRSSPDRTRYHTIKPGETFKIPLYYPRKNLAGNLVEGKQITNLTEGVPGDVAFSVVDGNNYTHWQPMFKSYPGKLLIDLGENGSSVINSGKIIWGSRPAKYISLSILPNANSFHSNLTHIIANANDYCRKNNSQKLTPVGHNSDDNEDLIDYIFDWYDIDAEDLADFHMEQKLTSRKFVKLLDHFPINPSEPYQSEIMNQSKIILLHGNETNFSINYSNISAFNPSLTSMDLSTNSTDLRQTRFLLFTVHDTYDDDYDPKGATIKEIALFS